MQDSNLYLSLAQRFETAAEMAKMFNMPQAMRLGYQATDECMKYYHAAKHDEEERDRNFKPFGFVFDENGEARPMTQAELDERTKYAEPDDEEPEEQADDPLEDPMTFAKWSGGYETSI